MNNPYSYSENSLHFYRFRQYNNSCRVLPSAAGQIFCIENVHYIPIKCDMSDLKVYQTKNWTADYEQEYQHMYKELKGSADFDLSAHPTPLLTTESGYLTTDIFVRT